jgi:uncharacterized protein (DUF924 family)
LPEPLGAIGSAGAIAAVLDFWFEERCSALWFVRDAAFDDEIRLAFGDLAAAAAASKACTDWVVSAEGALALVILLDQFPRNLHRGSPRAFAADPIARRVAAAAIAAGFDRATPWDRRKFFYLPFEHSEDPAEQALSVELFAAWVAESPPEKRAAAEDQFEYVLRHQEIIERFGRFPHRNIALGRMTTPEEALFLQEPRSSF